MDFVKNIHNGWVFHLSHFDKNGNAHLIHNSLKGFGTIPVSNENFRAHFERKAFGA